MSICQPPSSKRRRIDLTSEPQSIYSFNSNTNVGKSSSSTSTYYKSLDIETTSDNFNSSNYHNTNHHTRAHQHKSSLYIMETRSILEHIHSFLELEEILSSRQICKSWNEYFKIKILPSSLSSNRSDCNLFPLYMREMFGKSIGNFEHWLLFFICEYRNTEFKLKNKIKSLRIYPFYPNDDLLQNDSGYPHKTRFNLITNNTQEYQLYERLLSIFMFERHRKYNITLHNMLFCWLRGLKPLALYWLDLYDINNLNKDLQQFHKQLSCDYIEPEYCSIPLLQNIHLTKFDFLSSYLGLITINGDFELFNKLFAKIELNPASNNSLLAFFPKQHFANHVYQHRHTFGFGYNVYGLCHINLIDIALQICDIPRSVCSLKIIRFVIQPHLLVNIQSDLCLNKYVSGNILSVSLNKRIILLKKLCFYFDLCATIHSSNQNRANSNEYLVYSQLKKPFGNHNNENDDIAHLINNFQVWKRYILLCHLKYFIQKYKNKFNFTAYIANMFNAQPTEINDLLWKKLKDLIRKVIVLYPALEDILKQQNETENVNHLQIDKYLKQQFNEYRSAIILLDCIGDIYSVDENRNSLKVIERRGPLTIGQYETLKQCILASQHIVDHFEVNYSRVALHNSIANISFHHNQMFRYEDSDDMNMGLSLKHGTEARIAIVTT